MKMENWEPEWWGKIEEEVLLNDREEAKGGVKQTLHGQQIPRSFIQLA